MSSAKIQQMLFERVAKEFGGDNAENVKKERKTKKKVEQDGYQKPKKALTAYFCFMNATRQQVKDENPDDKIGDIAKKLGTMWKSMGEEEKKPFQEMAAKDKERHQKEMEEFQKTKVNVEPKVEDVEPKVEDVEPKVETPANEPVKDPLDDKFEKAFDNEEVGGDDEDDEVAVVEYTYKGTKYLLDPETKKVYNMEQEFVGKLEKKKINFDAVDSDEE